MEDQAPKPSSPNKIRLALAGPAIAVVVAGALVYATFVRSSSGDSAPPQVDVPSGFQAAAEEVVTAAKLTAADLPGTWLSQPQVEDDEDPQLSGECEVFNSDELPGQLAVADSDELTGPAQQRVFSTAVAFPSNESAAYALGLYDQWTGACREEMAAAFRETMHQSFLDSGVTGQDASTLDVGIAPLDFDGPRDGTKAIRIDWTLLVEGKPAIGSIDFVIWQEGPLLGGFVYVINDESPDVEDQQLVADAMAAKLSAAALFLPS